MKLKLRVVGSKNLLEQIRTHLLPGSASTQILWDNGAQCELSYIANDLTPEDMVCFAEAPAVLVIDAANIPALSRIDGMQNKISTLLQENKELPLRPAQVIVVLESRALFRSFSHSQAHVNDWLFAERLEVELAFRLLTLAYRNSEKRYLLQSGTARMLPDTRTIVLGEVVARLPPSEYALAEFFFTKLGSIVTLSDLSHFFESTGKSSAVNNIRVTIYQLRMKLEALSNSRLTIMTVYRKGYCLKQVTGNTRVRQPDPLTEVAI